MKLESSLILEDSLYMRFEIKDNELYFELDEPDDINLTFTIKNKSNSEEPKTLHQSVGTFTLDYGSYAFIFHTKKCTKLLIEFYKNRFEICEVSMDDTRYDTI